MTITLKSSGGQIDPLSPLPVERITVDGLHRNVRLYVPTQLPIHPAVVVALHGSGGDGERFRRFTAGAFDRLADRHGFVVAYPDALGGQWHDCRARAPIRPPSQALTTSSSFEPS